MDSAGRLLAAAVWLLPPEHQEWGRAMRAELAALPSGSARWAFAAGCLRATGWPGPIVRYLLSVAAAVALALLTGTGGAVRVEVIGLGLLVPPALGRLGRRDALVGAVGPTRAARVARRGLLAVLAGCVVVGLGTVVVTLPRAGSGTDGYGAVAGLTLVVAVLAGYTALGFAATSATATVPGATLAAAGWPPPPRWSPVACSATPGSTPRWRTTRRPSARWARARSRSRRPAARC